MIASRPIFLALAFASVSTSAAVAQGQTQCSDFVQICSDTEQKANAIRAAGKRKADPKEMCGLFQRFATAEGLMIKFLVDNKTWCGVPDDAIKTAKMGHERTLKLRTAVCTGGSIGEGPKPKPPSLSDAIGTPTIDSKDNTKTGRGTFDTLTGSPLGR